MTTPMRSTVETTADLAGQLRGNANILGVTYLCPPLPSLRTPLSPFSSQSRVIRYADAHVHHPWTKK